jgi:hypothetical protein
LQQRPANEQSHGPKHHDENIASSGISLPAYDG